MGDIDDTFESEALAEAIRAAEKSQIAFEQAKKIEARELKEQKEGTTPKE